MVGRSARHVRALHGFQESGAQGVVLAGRIQTARQRDPSQYESRRKQNRRYQATQMHDLNLFMTNTGLRPDEAKRLQYRDVSIVNDEATDEMILEIEVRGKRGTGYYKSMTGAVLPFQRLKERNDPNPIDPIFPYGHKKVFNRMLEAEDLKIDRKGKRHTLYSLWHGYISFRLLKGANIYQIAKN